LIARALSGNIKRDPFEQTVSLPKVTQINQVEISSGGANQMVARSLSTRPI
jgi:hypothetical protein